MIQKVPKLVKYLIPNVHILWVFLTSCSASSQHFLVVNSRCADTVRETALSNGSLTQTDDSRYSRQLSGAKTSVVSTFPAAVKHFTVGLVPEFPRFGFLQGIFFLCSTYLGLESFSLTRTHECSQRPGYCSFCRMLHPEYHTIRSGKLLKSLV